MFEHCLYFNTNTLARQLNAVWEKSFESYDLSPSHAYLLLIVLKSPGLCQQELTEKMSLNKSTITRFIMSLEKKGLLIRKDKSIDQREKLIFPSNKSIAIHNELAKTCDDLYSTMCEVVGKEQLESFVNVARKINDNL